MNGEETIMSSNGKDNEVSAEVLSFVRLLTQREVLDITYTDLDGESHQLGIRTTKNLGDYLLALNVALLSRTKVVPTTPPKGGFRA